MNNIKTWLYLIGTPERARKLRMRVDGLVPPPLDELYGSEPCQCPTTVLFGASVARSLYADPATRPALDAYDTGMVSKADLRRYCLDIERLKYYGPVFEPNESWLARLREQNVQNLRKAESLRESIQSQESGEDVQVRKAIPRQRSRSRQTTQT